MLAVLARRFNPLSLPKAGYQIGLSSLLLLASAGVVHDAAALNETRTLSFHHTHSGEDLTVTFKRDGRYDEDGLKKLNHLLRDWRNQDETVMDRRLFDVLWEVYRDVDAKQPIHIVSAYRSPETNAMLRRRSSGVARHSQHMLGHAMDFFIPGVQLEQIRYAGLRQQRGGVGFYPTSGSPFVHLDTGNVRHWPRMNHDQLARVFPDGRTVHVPSDGNPLKGYELARADIERRGDGSVSVSPGKATNFLAALFKRSPSSSAGEDDDEGPTVAAKPVPTTTIVAAAAPAKSAEPIPMPRAKPSFAAAIQLASADSQSVPLPRIKPQIRMASADKVEPAPQTPADIINARGFWGDDAAPRQATAAQVAALKARDAVASEPSPTPSLSDNISRAMAYAPAASSPVDRANIVAASAPLPRSARPARNPAAATEINTVVTKTMQSQGSVIATSTRLSAARVNDIWMRVFMLAPSATNGMVTTALGDPDMNLMRVHFVKPRAAINMAFADDPMLGLSTDRFTGSVSATLPTISFVQHTATLR